MSAPDNARLYLGADGRWSDDPREAVLRLDVSVRQRVVSAQARNSLHAPDGNGGWTPVVDESDLSPIQRGLVWELWKTSRRGQTFTALRGVRAVDESVALLLEGLLLRDAAGDIVEDPKAAGRLFLLSDDDTRQFLRRVKAAGGQVHRAELTPQAATSAVVRAQRALAEMEALGAHDQQAVLEARGRDFSGLPAFQRRDGLIRDQFAAVRNAYDDCQRSAEALTQPGISVPERAAGEQVLGQAREALQRAGVLLEEREAAEGEIARWYAHAAGGPDPHRTPAARLLLFRELGRVLAQDGLEVQATASGVRVRTPVGWIALGPGLQVESLPAG